MTKNDALLAREANAKYGFGGWQWADLVVDEDFNGALIHGDDCRCAEGSPLFFANCKITKVKMTR